MPACSRAPWPHVYVWRHANTNAVFSKTRPVSNVWVVRVVPRAGRGGLGDRGCVGGRARCDDDGAGAGAWSSGPGTRQFNARASRARRGRRSEWLREGERGRGQKTTRERESRRRRKGEREREEEEEEGTRGLSNWLLTGGAKKKRGAEGKASGRYL